MSELDLPSETDSASWAGWVLTIASAVAILSAFLPWRTATAAFVGTVNRSGVDGGGDGFIVIGLAIPLLVFGIRNLRLGATPPQRWSLVLAIALVALAIYEWFSVRNNVATANRHLGSLGSASIGAGLWILVLAGIASLVGIIAFLRRTVGVQPKDTDRR